MHHLTESVRRHYLDTMGLTQWYVRSELAGGARLIWEEEPGVAEQAVPEKSPLHEKTAKPLVSDVASEQSSSSALQPPDKPQQVEVKETAASADKDVTATHSEGVHRTTSEASPQAGIEFVQRWWARDGWCIVDTRAKQMPEDQQKAADRLMAGLAQAVSGERKPTVAHRIDWPLFVNRSIPHDENEARFYLSQKWRAVQQQCEVKRLILLGDKTPALLSCPPPEENTDAWVHDGMACIRAPGSSELMHLPGEKRAFWNRLRAWLNSP